MVLDFRTIVAVADCRKYMGRQVCRLHGDWFVVKLCLILKRLFTLSRINVVLTLDNLLVRMDTVEHSVAEDSHARSDRGNTDASKDAKLFGEKTSKLNTGGNDLEDGSGSDGMISV